MKSFFNDSLVKVQASNKHLDMEPLIRASMVVSQRIYTETKDESLRKIFAQTGLSIKSCKILSDRIREKVGLFIDFCEGYGKQELILELIVESLVDLNEMTGSKNISYNEGFEDYNLILGWINLMSIPALATEFTNEDDVEKVAEYIDKKFVYRLSWGANAFTKIAAYEMGMELEDLPIFFKYISSMIKFGVNTHYASWAMSLGIHSRNLAHRIGTKFKEDKGEIEDFSEFVEWFKNLNAEKIGLLGQLETSALENRVLKLDVNTLPEFDKVITKIKKEGMVTRIKGFEYEDRLKNFEQLLDGQNLYLKRDYQNTHDIDAIKIYYKDKELGFITRELAKILAPQIDFGLNFRATLESKSNKTIKIE